MLVYDEYGASEAPTLLLLHGAAALDTFSGLYDSLSRQYHLVIPHLAGAGQAVGVCYEPQAQHQELLELAEALRARDPLHRKLGLMGHSLGGQQAALLACARPEWFSCAVLLSVWLDPSPMETRLYCSFARMGTPMLHCKSLVRLQGRYWHYTPAQAERMAQDAARLTPEVYESFFAHTLRRADLAGYRELSLPMLAVCGSGEVGDIKRGLSFFAQNPHCRTVLLPHAGHDFPMRRAGELNALVEPFLAEFLK